MRIELSMVYACEKLHSMNDSGEQLISPTQISFAKSDDDLVQIEPNTDSFWDIGNFKPVVKRYEDGARLCSEFMKMVQERADIEAKYAKLLQNWGHKWEEVVSNGSEYGSLVGGWKACFREAEKVGNIHKEMSDALQNIAEDVHSWKSENYHKALMHLKEAKKAEDGFFKAQKPWAKRLQKLQRSKKGFHAACKELNVLSTLLCSSEGTRDISKDQLFRIKEKKDRVQKEVDKCKEKYKERLEDSQHYKSRYIEDMTIQFDKCQQFERGRILFFHAAMSNIKAVLETTTEPRFHQVYIDYAKMLEDVNAHEDLKLFSKTTGVDMQYSWPEFDEYVPEQFTKEDSLISTTNSQSEISHLSAKADGEDSWLEPPPHYKSDTSQAERKGSEEPGSCLMRALYDYSGPDEDDLCFKEGDLIRVMYTTEDGWAEGVMGEKYGYVPLSWLEHLP